MNSTQTIQTKSTQSPSSTYGYGQQIIKIQGTPEHRIPRLQNVEEPKEIQRQDPGQNVPQGTFADEHTEYLRQRRAEKSGRQYQGRNIPQGLPADEHRDYLRGKRAVEAQELQIDEELEEMQRQDPGQNVPQGTFADKNRDYSRRRRAGKTQELQREPAIPTRVSSFAAGDSTSYIRSTGRSQLNDGRKSFPTAMSSTQMLSKKSTQSSSSTYGYAQQSIENSRTAEHRIPQLYTVKGPEETLRKDPQPTSSSS